MRVNPTDHHEHKSSNSWIFWMDIFEIILLPFLGHWTQKLSAPSAAISSLNSIPVSCIKNFWLSNNIFEPCCLLYWQMFNVLTDPPPFYYSFKLWWFFSVPAIVNLLRADPSVPSFTPPIAVMISSPQMGESVLRLQLGIPTSTILWLGVPHHLQKESRYKLTMDKW